MRSDGIPCYVSPGDTATAMNPVRLDKKEIREGFLQQMLHEHPDLLPVAKLDEAFAPLAALGREIRGMDNLFVSPDGRLTVSEQVMGGRGRRSARLRVIGPLNVHYENE